MELQNIQNHMLHNFGMQQSSSSSVGSAQDPMNSLYMDCSLSWSESFNYNQDKQYNCPPYQYNSGGITDWYGVQYNSCAVSSGFEGFEEPKETLEDSFSQRYSKPANTSGGFYSNGDLGFSQFSGNGFWPEENWIDTLRGPPILTNSDVSTVLCLPNSPSIPSGQEEQCSDDGSDIIVEESEEESEICISEDVDDWKLGQLIQETLPVQKTLLWCSICGKGFALKRVLTKHIRSHDPDSRLQCEICGRTYSVRHKLTTHLVEVHGTGKTVECKECGRKFRRERNLLAHVKRAHSGGGVATAVKRHRCPTCDKGFSHPSDLASHQASHSSAKPHSCQVCGRSYKSRSHLNHHKKTKHEQPPAKNEEADEETVPVAKKLLCQTCGARFSHKRYLRRHCKEQHEADGAPSRVECPVCGKRTRASDLKTHLRVHTGEKPYSCDRCGVVFSVKSSLNKHLRLKHPET